MPRSRFWHTTPLQEDALTALPTFAVFRLHNLDAFAFAFPHLSVLYLLHGTTYQLRFLFAFPLKYSEIFFLCIFCSMRLEQELCTFDEIFL